MVQKYSHDGSKLLLTIGKKGVFDSSDGTAKGKPLNSNAAAFYMPSSIFVDRQNGDVYVSDGEGAGGNRRVAVMDRTGKFLRQWQPADMEGRPLLDHVERRTGLRLQSQRVANPGVRQDGNLQEEHRGSLDSCDTARGWKADAEWRFSGRDRFLSRSPLNV
jgi:hypothetical protein